MTLLPLLPAVDSAIPLAIYHGEAISRPRFLAQVLHLAEQLPAGGRVLNLCTNRYAFAVSLFAAIRQGCLTVLPNSAASEHLATVADEHPGLLVLGDQTCSPLPHLDWLRVNDSLAGLAQVEAAVPLIPAGQQIACVYTSGSTGRPVAHYKSFGAVCRSIAAGAGRVWQVAGGPCSVVGTSPIRHMYGLESGVLLPILGGGCLSPEVPFFPADVVRCLQALPEPRLLVITPYHLRHLIESGVALPPLAAIVSATAPLGEQLARQAGRQGGCPVLEIYGSTETGQLATRQPVIDAIWETLPGRYLEPDGTGEIWACGGDMPQVLNDRVELLSSTRFRLIDRKAGLVNVAGKRSSLAFLNGVLSGLPGVKDGVFFLPSHGNPAQAGRLAAFVVAPGCQRSEILAGLREHLDPVFLPRPLLLVDHLPRDGNGKIQAAALQRLINTYLPDRT